MTGKSKPVKGHAFVWRGWDMSHCDTCGADLGLIEASVCECGRGPRLRLHASRREAREAHREHKAAVLAAREETKA